MSYLVYGKVIKPVPLPDGKGHNRIVKPQTTFRALNYQGQRVTKLADADDYAEREDAQMAIDKAEAYWESRGYKGHIAFEIRKAK